MDLNKASKRLFGTHCSFTVTFIGSKYLLKFYSFTYYRRQLTKLNLKV